MSTRLGHGYEGMIGHDAAIRFLDGTRLVARVDATSDSGTTIGGGHPPMTHGVDDDEECDWESAVEVACASFDDEPPKDYHWPDAKGVPYGHVLRKHVSMAQDRKRFEAVCPNEVSHSSLMLLCLAGDMRERFRNLPMHFRYQLDHQAEPLRLVLNAQIVAVRHSDRFDNGKGETRLSMMLLWRKSRSRAYTDLDDEWQAIEGERLAVEDNDLFVEV